MEKLPWFREPLLHFFVIGAMLFVFYSVVNPGEDTDANMRIVSVQAHALEQVAANRAKQLGAAPGKEELADLFKDYLRMETLYEDANAMGLMQSDRELRSRLASRLVFMIEEELADREPTDQELNEWFEAHKDEYKLPDQISFRHVYFSKRDGENETQAYAKGVLDEFTALPNPLEADMGRGDPYPKDINLENVNEWELAQAFGEAFAKTVMNLEPGVWTGPIESEKGGQHLVIVTKKTAAHLPNINEVKERVRGDWFAEVVRNIKNNRAYQGIISTTEFQFTEDAKALLDEYGIQEDAIIP